MGEVDAEIAKFVNEQRERVASAERPLPFTLEEYMERQDKLKHRMAESKIDLLLVSSPEGIAWLTGHALRWNKAQSTSAWPPMQCVAVPAEADGIVLFETAEHKLMIETRSCVSDFCLSADESFDGMLKNMMSELRARGWLGRSVGVERLSYVPNRAIGNGIEEELKDAGCKILDASLLVRAARRQKSAKELEYTRRAVEICDAGLDALEAALSPGITELELWAEMMKGMISAGGEPAALHESVTVGTSGLGHAFSERRKIQEGDFVCADPCGVYNHYHGNVANAFYLGSEPPTTALRLADIQAKGFEILTSNARAGISVREVTESLMEYYKGAGVWGLNSWIGGYELGISFPPDWVGEFLFSLDEMDRDGVFESGLVTNFESIVNLAMIDTVIYSDEGAECLSRRPHGLSVVEV